MSESQDEIIAAKELGHIVCFLTRLKLNLLSKKYVFRKVLVALRHPEDVIPIVKFLKDRNERPALVLLTLSPSNFVKGSVVSFNVSKSGNDLNRFKETLSSLPYEVVELYHDASELPASIVSKEALDRKCDAILVVTSGDKGLFATDFASSIVLESSLPVLVIRD
jgi:nucleotide-binding universal stress UspA family protein